MDPRDKALVDANMRIMELEKKLREAGCPNCNPRKRAAVLGDQTKGVHLGYPRKPHKEKHMDGNRMSLPAMLREGSMRNDWELRQAASARILELEEALRRVVRDVNDYEEANKLHPNPGCTECWDSVAYAKAILQER